MQCSQFMELLEREPDGPLSAWAVDHLDCCPRCRLVFDDLEGIRLAGFEWALEQEDQEGQLEPSPRIWLELREQLEAEGLIREARPVEVPVSRSHWWTRGWTLRPALVGVPVLLTAVALLNLPGGFSAGLGRLRGNTIPHAQTASTLPAEIDRNLDSDIQRVMASLPAGRPLLSRALQQNLSIVDNMIATCEKSVREQPDNPMVREYLYGAYQQKAVLLSTAMERTTLEDR